jgi:hypothetical protein
MADVFEARRQGGTGVFRIAPLPGELTSCLIDRVAARYGMPAQALRAGWQWRSSRPRHDHGGVRADAEVLLNAEGRRLLAELCGTGQDVLARALPSWAREDTKFAAQDDGVPEAVWRIGSMVAGPVSFGCRLCTARRTGMAVRVVRYAPRWERVCLRHGRWLLDADADQPLEHLDVHRLPEITAAQRQWRGVARRAVRAGAEPGKVFALAHAVVARWWERALLLEQESVWPRRLHQVAGGNAGGDLERWRIVGRDAVVFPEVVVVADALLDPGMADLVWVDSGAGRPRALPVDGEFCRRLGERVGRSWLGPLAAGDHGGPLIAWMGSVIRLRRGAGGTPGYADDPWWVRQEHQPATMSGQLRVLGKEKRAPGSGTMWRTVVPPEQRARIGGLIESAEEQLVQLRGVQAGPTAEVARQLLRSLGHSARLVEGAWKRTAVAAVNGGVPLEEVARWAGMPADALRDMWWSATTRRHVSCGSAAMRAQLMVLDREPRVVGLAGRPVRLLWRNDRGQVRSWVPQLFARYADGTALLADCPGHPDAGGERAAAAAQAVAAACADTGWIYRRLAPLDEVLAANLKWLAGYRHPRNQGRAGLMPAVLDAFARPRPLIEGAQAAGDPIEVLPVVFHALWHHILTTPLTTPLHERVTVATGSFRADRAIRAAARGHDDHAGPQGEGNQDQGAVAAADGSPAPSGAQGAAGSVAEGGQSW